MGRPPSGTRKDQLQGLTERHREVLRLVVPGKGRMEIARELGISPSSVTRAKNSTVAQPILAELQTERNVDTTRMPTPMEAKLERQLADETLPIERLLARG